MYGVLLALVLPAATTQIAVMDTKVDGGADAMIGGQITARIAEVLGTRSDTSVIAPDDIRAMLEQESQKQLLGCSEESCLAEIGGALGADILISSRISKLGDGFGVSMSAVEPKTARAIGHVTETWRGPSIMLLELIAPMIDKLLSPKGTVLTGAIDVQGAVDGSRILVDDQVRGTAPAGAMANIPIGARRVQIVADDYRPYERWIIVRTGETATVPAEQEAVPTAPFYETWWFWTATAVVVGAAVATPIVLTQGDDPAAPNPGATGVNVSVNANEAFMGGR